ncbi:MAG: hypothetical protein ACSLFQ_10150 [Thermoanaerobaculia bacterium]
MTKVYTKLYVKTLKSSIMRAPFQVRAVFMHLLLLSKDLGLKGLVPRDHFYLARVLAIPEDVLEGAIKVLLDRDEFNADDEFEGRRLVVEGEHYRIVSWSRYQSDPDPTHAERQRRYRENQKSSQERDASLRHSDGRGTGSDASPRHRDDGDLETTTTTPLTVVRGAKDGGRAEKPIDPGAARLAGVLLDGHLRRDPDFVIEAKRPATIERWSRDIEKLLRLDHRSPEQVETVIRFCLTDSFEQANVQSGAKLRERFPALLQKATTRRQTSTANRPFVAQL